MTCKCRGGDELCPCHLSESTIDCRECAAEFLGRMAVSDEKATRRDRFLRHSQGP